MPVEWGRVTARAKLVATAASTAFPPAANSRAPAWAASGSPAATIPRADHTG